MPTIKVNQAELYYEDVGSGPETLLFVHGLCFSQEMFRDQIAAFSGKYRCVSYDLRGHGRSELTTGGYDCDDLARDAAAVIDQLKLGPVHLVGWSSGGFAGMRLALERPELLRSLILIGAATFDGTDLPFVRLKLMPYIVPIVGSKALAKKALTGMFSPKTLKTERGKAMFAEWRQRFGETSPHGIARLAKGATSQRSILDKLGGIKAPTILIRGEEDELIRQSWMKQTADAIPGARLVEIPNTRRACNMESPEQFNAIMGDFLQSVRATA